MFIEANYSSQVIEDNAVENRWNSSASTSHMEINTTIDVIKHNLSSSLKTICLLHLSDVNSDESMFKQMVWKETGRACYIAEKGLEIELNKEEF